jgi:hypothetical protein
LLYLSDVEEGGETAFPDSDWIDPAMVGAFGRTGGGCSVVGGGWRGHVCVFLLEDSGFRV